MTSEATGEHRNAVQLKGLCKRYGEVAALDSVSLTIREGEYFSLLGPSGCGKTTLLRIIAGLEVADDGELFLCGELSGLTPAHCRPVNTVFQNYALFPHMTVRQNVAFGLRMKKVGKTQIVERVSKVAEMVRIEDLLDRMPERLSGGQKQRVALARAVVNEPKVLLLDEPLAALDLSLRKQLQDELRNLQRRVGISFIHVTHDQTEAFALSDRLALMNRGRIEQVGSPTELYHQPKSRFAASFLGACNIFEGRFLAHLEGCALVETSLGELRVQTHDGGLSRGSAVVCLGVRPESVTLRPGPGIENIFRGHVREVVFSGSETRVTLTSGSLVLQSVLPSPQAHLLKLLIGGAIEFSILPSAVRVLEG